MSFTGPDDGARRTVLAMLGAPWCSSFGRLGLALAAGLTAGACSPRPATPATVPDFDYTLLDGTRARSQALHGQVMLINFWATSCGICVQEMPQLAALHQRFAARGLQTLAVAMQYDPPSRVADFAQSRQLPFGVVIDNTGAIARSFGDLRGTPTTFVFDRQGRAATRIEGQPDFAELTALIDQLLAQA